MANLIDSNTTPSGGNSAPVLDVLPDTAAPLPPPLPPPLPREFTHPSLSRRLLRFPGKLYRIVASIVGWLFGAASLLAGLAVLASLPILQFLSLGYLLEAGGRVARSGRLRDGFIGVRLAGQLGGILLGAWLLLLPVRFVSGMASSAQIIDPGGVIAGRWRFWLLMLIGLTAVHIVAACARGGRLRYFFWPFNIFWLVGRLRQGGYYAQGRDAVWDTFQALRLPYYFWLGLRGFVAAFVWLCVPVTLIAVGRDPGPAALLGFLGAFLLAIVLLYLPFLQMRLAETNTFSAGFGLRAVRADFKRAPWAFLTALFITLLTALPLYLLKIEMVPREATWLPSLVFISFIFPARLLTGWAVSRARRRDQPRHWFLRWTGWFPLLPIVAFYVLIVYFTQFTSWNGVWSLYEQHAFLVPVPFFGM